MYSMLKYFYVIKHVSEVGSKQALLDACFMLVCLAYVVLNSEDGGNMFLRNVGLNFNGLHSVIFQEEEFLKIPVLQNFIVINFCIRFLILILGPQY
jgi:hypothetical protein